MPKKIKQKKEKELKNKKEKVLNVNNIHFVIIGVVLLLCVIVAIVGMTKYSIDKYHAHASVAVVRMEYFYEGENGNFNYSFSVIDGEPSGTANTPEKIDNKIWGEKKYLDFNEELYATGILENESQARIDGVAKDWYLEIETIKGDKYFYSSDSGVQIDRTALDNLVKKYFK